MVTYICVHKLVNQLSSGLISLLLNRAVPDIRFVFASGPNNGPNGYSVFG